MADGLAGRRAAWCKPRVLDLNILLRGQSNAVYFTLDRAGDALGAEVAGLLGLDGRTARVRVLGGPDSTEQSGTALIWDQPGGSQAWLRRPPDGSWAPGPLERRLLAMLAALPAPIRAAPTLTVWMHNETDSDNPGVTRALWRDAVRAEAGWARAALGQTPATTPYLFAWVPFDVGAGPAILAQEDAGAAQIRLAMADLVADQSFHAVAAPQTGDMDMDGGAGGRLGGMHISLTDALRMAHRLARPIACAFLPYASPGAPIASQSCGAGPVAVSACRMAAGRVAVALALRPGVPLAALGGAAAGGAGWTARSADGSILPASAAARDGAARLVLTFGQAPPAAASIQYGYGHGRLSAPDGRGEGAGIYDADGAALSAPPAGLAATSRCPPGR